MKKIIGIVVIFLVMGITSSEYIYAGDEGWAAAGGFLGGMVVGSALSSGSYYSGPSYYYPTTYAYPVYSTYGYRNYYYPNCYPRYSYPGYYRPYYYPRYRGSYRRCWRP